MTFDNPSEEAWHQAHLSQLWGIISSKREATLSLETIQGQRLGNKETNVDVNSLYVNYFTIVRGHSCIVQIDAIEL